MFGPSLTIQVNLKPKMTLQNSNTQFMAIHKRIYRTNQDFARTYRKTTKSTEMSLRTIQDQTEDNV